jgi:streptomycin 6-kinase
MAESALGQIASASTTSAVAMHGDFCFSNILYNARMRRIRTLDPRGYLSGKENSYFGDTRYDLAKLAHSVTGRYDEIISGRYDLESSSENLSIGFDQTTNALVIRDAWSGVSVGPHRGDDEDVKAIVVTLFLSMLPLHADRPDRQRAFVANAARLYAQLESS